MEMEIKPVIDQLVNFATTYGLQIIGAIIILIVGAFSLVASRWEWFFEKFHELFFDGNWRFPLSSLMIRLWGGCFFPLAAAYAGVKSVIVGVFLSLLGRITSLR